MKNLNELHTKLREDLINQQGDVSFNLAGINHTLTSSDIIGNCIQSWLKSWFAINKVKFRELDNTQEFPDYFVELNGIEYMLEIKCWNAKGSPAFDIANITSYLNMIKQSPKKLEANYFIFAYHYDINTAKITIDNVYNKKIYEIAGLTKNNTLKVQKKYGTYYNIRPMNFPKKTKNDFNNYNEFLISLRDVLKDTPQGNKIDLDEWYNNIPSLYKK